jgi:hypothetical protein
VKREYPNGLNSKVEKTLWHLLFRDIKHLLLGAFVMWFILKILS